MSCIAQRNPLAWSHRRRELASDGVRYAGARSSVGRRFRSVTKLRLEWYGGVFLLLQQRSKHPREIVITPKASTSRFPFFRWANGSLARRRPDAEGGKAADIVSARLKCGQAAIYSRDVYMAWILNRVSPLFGGPTGQLSTQKIYIFLASRVPFFRWANKRSQPIYSQDVYMS